METFISLYWIRFVLDPDPDEPTNNYHLRKGTVNLTLNL